MQKKITALIIAMVFLSIAAVVYFSVLREPAKVDLSFRDAAGKPLIEEQVKLDIPDVSVFEKLKDVDNILSYRLKTKGVYNYRDYYYDTPGLDLFKSGYSYRLRIRDKGDGFCEYGLQFKKEYVAENNKNFTRTEVDDIIPEDAAKEMLSGNWLAVFSDRYDFLTIKDVRRFLSEKNIDYRLLAPFLYCQQKRYRLRLYEHSVWHFEISLDDVLFSLVKDADKRHIHFFQLEFENKLKGAISKNDRRIEELIGFFVRNYSLKVERDSKYRKAVLELTGR